LLGFDLYGRTVGVIGTGKIGACFARIMAGFGCTLLGADPVENADCRALGMRYVPVSELLAQSDVISLHCPLNERTRGLIGDSELALMRREAILINCSRGDVIDKEALVRTLLVCSW
jgi:D-lactate dehydrogenase